MSEKFQVQKEHPAHLDRFTGLQDLIHGGDLIRNSLSMHGFSPLCDRAQVCPASSIWLLNTEYKI